MTVYAGEVVRIKSSATGYDDAPLTNDDITAATIEIFDSAGDVVEPATPMTYSISQVNWFFDWITADVPAGTYKAKVRLTGELYDNWEIITVRLKESPV